MPQLYFNHLQTGFLRALAEALFDDFTEMAITTDQVVDNLQTIFSMIGGTKAQEISTAVTLADIAMGPLFTALSIEHRKARIEHRMRDTEFYLFKDMARLRALLYFSYYGYWQDAEDGDAMIEGQKANENNPVHRQIGFTLPLYRTRTPDERPLTRIAGRDINPRHVINREMVGDDIDIIVIGSGSGGSVSARNLARRGYKVLMVEAGPFYPSYNITHEERAMASHLFKHGALQSSKNDEFIVFQGRNVGGSPTINNGICIHLFDDPLTHPDAPNPLDLWDTMGASLDRNRMRASFDAVQDYLQIRSIEPQSSRSNGPHLLRGWGKFAIESNEVWAQRAKAGWFSKNFGPAGTEDACAYCGYCNTGCGYGRRNGMGQSYLPDACTNHGMRILDRTRVERILWQKLPHGRRRATGVEIIDEDGVKQTIAAKKGVVVACGTIASSLLLDRSDVDGTGKGISLNIASPIPCLMPEGTSPAWDEDQMATMVDCGDFLLESHFQPPLSMASLMPGWFGEMDRRMRNYSRICSAGVLFPGDRRGHISGGKLDFQLEEWDRALLRRAAATLTRVHFAAGALEVWPATLKGQTLYPGDDIDAFFEEAIRAPGDVTLSSSHPHGGNPMHADPDAGVVDTELRVHGTENVLVTDASVFPSCIRVNAQFSTMAIAHYATGFADPFAAC